VVCTNFVRTISELGRRGYKIVRLGRFWFNLTISERAKVALTIPGGLLNEPVKYIANNMFEVTQKPVDRVSGWRLIKSAVVPTESVLELPCCRSSAINGLVIAMQ
jgi:hypothetical protein